MKFFVITAILFCNLYSIQPSEDFDDDAFIPINEVFSKAKKIPNSSFSRHGQDNCPNRCLHALKSKLETDSDLKRFVKNQFQPFRFSNQFDPVMTAKYCLEINSTTECVHGCINETGLAQLAYALALKKLSIPEYICRETRFVEYSACYKRVNNEMESICHSNNKCAEQKAQLQNVMHMQPTCMEDVTNMIETKCNYLTCFNECDQRKMIDECGIEAYNVLIGLYKKALTISKELFDSIGMRMEMPRQCSRIGYVEDVDDESEI